MLSQIQTCLACPSFQRQQGSAPMCKANGTPIRFYDPEYACPVGPWVPEKVWRYGDAGTVRPAPVIDTEKAAAQSFWQRLGGAAGKTVVAALDLASKGTQLVQVKTSGRAPDDVILARHASCCTCAVRKDAQSRPIPIGTPLGPDQWCGDCGCGTRAWARLDEKLTHAYLPCPRRRAGFSNSPAPVAPPEPPVPGGGPGFSP